MINFMGILFCVAGLAHIIIKNMHTAIPKGFSNTRASQTSQECQILPLFTSLIVVNSTAKYDTEEIRESSNIKGYRVHMKSQVCQR